MTAARSLKTENRGSRTREVRSHCVFKLPFGEELTTQGVRTLSLATTPTASGRNSPKKNGIMRRDLITSWLVTTPQRRAGSRVQTNPRAGQMNFLFALAIRKSKLFLTLRLLNLNL